MKKMNVVFAFIPTKAPKVLFIMKGTFHIPVTKDEHGDDKNYVTIEYPLIIIGAGQDKTTIYGGFYIQRKQEEGKKIVLQDITVKGSSRSGVYSNNGLSFLCKSMTFTQCGGHGVYASNTKGRLISCVITQCQYSGIFCNSNALVELEGSQTKVHGNVTNGDWDSYGLCTYDTSSVIHLLFPLKKESVSTNNGGGGNYGVCLGKYFSK